MTNLINIEMPKLNIINADNIYISANSFIKK